MMAETNAEIRDYVELMYTNYTFNAKARGTYLNQPP